MPILNNLVDYSDVDFRVGSTLNDFVDYFEIDFRVGESVSPTLTCSVAFPCLDFRVGIFDAT